MGNIPIKRAKYGPPTKVATKPPWPEYRTRERRAMAGFGGAMVSLGERLGSIYLNQLVQSEFVKGKASLQQRNNEFFESLREDPDYEKYPERYTKESKKWQEEILSSVKTPGARNSLKNMITADAPRYESGLNDVIKGKAQEESLRNLSDSIEGFIPSAGAILEELELGVVNAIAAAQGAVAKGLLSKDQAEEQVIYALMTDWPEVALKEIDASSLESRRKIQLRSTAKGTIAQKQREQAAQLKVMREQTMSTMLADVWDGKLTDPQAVTDAFRAGYLDDTDAKYLRDAIKNPDPPENTNEALIAMRYAIKGQGEGTHEIEDALKELMKYSEQLDPATGKAFIKEIFGEHDTKNAFWNRQSHEYMEKQIMEVATMTGILYGSGEQLALSAQALMAYDEAKKAAITEGKPLNGRELLVLAHEVMLPFREQVKPLMEGEKLPETLVPKEQKGIQPPISTESRPAIRFTEKGKAIINSMVQPKSVEEFLSVYKLIPDKGARKRYYDKWAEKVKSAEKVNE